MTEGSRPLQVCLDARGLDATWGGVRETIIGLADGLSQLADGDERYVFCVERGADAWIAGHVRGSCGLLYVERPKPRPAPAWKIAVRPLIPPAVSRLVGRQLERFVRVEVPPSDGTIERAGVDVMHFTTQGGFHTAVPSIYVPHDLQHFHYPKFFTPQQHRIRAAFYPTLARHARHVVALSHHGKQDIVSHLGVPPERVSVIGWAPILDAYEQVSDADLASTQSNYRLPKAFALYPAQTWPHKNHLALIEAVSLLRHGGLEVPIVCTGIRNDFYAVIARRVRKLRLDHLIHFLDYVSPTELQALYRLARVLVFPSLFEGFGMPVVEAYRAALPVACSNVTSLPEVSAGCAVLFDPTRPDEIASSVRRLWTDDDLRSSLVRRARMHVDRLSWREVARRYRALYRTVGGRPTQEDRAVVKELA